MIGRSFALVALGGILCMPFAPAVQATDDHPPHAAPVGCSRRSGEATQDFVYVRAAMRLAMPRSAAASPVRSGARWAFTMQRPADRRRLVDARAPELLIYERRGGRLHFVGVEFLVLADQWNASHPGGEPPVLMGQHFQFVGTPNRYRLPAFYELHVWAWRDNRFGTFVDWNPDVSCDEYNPSAK